MNGNLKPGGKQVCRCFQPLSRHSRCLHHLTQGGLSVTPPLSGISKYPCARQWETRSQQCYCMNWSLDDEKHGNVLVTMPGQNNFCTEHLERDPNQQWQGTRNQGQYISHLVGVKLDRSREMMVSELERARVVMRGEWAGVGGVWVGVKRYQCRCWWRKVGGVAAGAGNHFQLNPVIPVRISHFWNTAG